jgi:plastocyanin
MNSRPNHRHRSAPTMDLPPPSRWVLVVALVFAFALAACSSSGPSATLTAATLGPSTPGPSTPVMAPSPSASAAASGGAGSDLLISAQGIKFSTKDLKAPADKAFSIAFENNDPGISHNVDILDANKTSVFKGAVFPGVATQTYQVPSLKAGTYSFICDVHPNVMTGTLTVG